MIDNAQNWANEIGKYLSGNCTDAEIDALMRWKNENIENRGFFEEMESVWQITQPSEQIIDIDLDKQWESVVENITPKVRSLLTRRFVYWSAAAAAALALMLFAIISQNQNYADSINQPILVSALQPDENELVILPDGSKVWLRSGSEISYDLEFSPRNVTLKGEGFFDVTSDRNHPFTVQTEQAFVRVLGTRFNLKETKSGDVELFVEEGKVSFGQDEQSASQSMVTRDQVAIFRINTLQVERMEIPDINRLSWKTGKLVFDNVTVGEVLRDLESHYNTNFEVTDQAMLQCDLKADFENSSLDEVIETIEFIMSWEIEKENDGFIVSGNPCKNTEK